MTLPRSIGLKLVVIATAVFTGNCTCGMPGSRCVPGRVETCPCQDGTTGHQICDEIGAGFAECVCSPSNVGVIDIRVAPVQMAVNLHNMAPGDIAEGTVTVTNSGSESLRYAIISTTDEARLAGVLELTVRLGSGGICSPNATLLYGPSMLGAPGGLNIVGNPGAGNDVGDRVLGSGRNELLCFWVELPLEVDNTFQGLGTTMNLDFVAEQIADNP